MRYIGRTVSIIVGVLLAMVVVYAALLFNSARILKSELEQAVKVASSSNLSVDVSGAQNGGGQFSEIKSVVPQLQEHTGKAREQADGVVWRIATAFPYIGDDFTAARTATDAFDTLAQQALPSLIDAANTMQQSGLSNGDGSFNVKSLSAVSSKIGGAKTVLQEQVAALHKAPEPHIGQVRDALKTGTGILDSLAGTISSYSDTITSLSALFGHDGTRHYLILSQTNAETKASGGLVGSVGMISVDNGRITMGEFRSDSQFKDTAPISGDDGHDQLPATSPIDMGATEGMVSWSSRSPNFPAVAQYAKDVWAGQSFGSSQIDGVMSFDTMALQTLIGVTGNVTLSTGQTLTSDNTAQYLSNQVYIDITDPTRQDAFFQESGQRIIGGAFSGINADKALKLVGALPKLARERHLYMWSFDKSDQTALRQAGMSGEISTDSSRPVTGVYVNEMAWTKTDWYMNRTVKVSRTSTGGDGAATYHVTYTTNNTMTPDQAKTLPAYITGTLPSGMLGDRVDKSNQPAEAKTALHEALNQLGQPGVAGHAFIIAQPAGGSVTNIKITSNSSVQVPALQSAFTKLSSNGTVYWADPVCTIVPGATVTLEYDVTTASGSAPLQFDQTPVIGEPKITYDYQH